MPTLTVTRELGGVLTILQTVPHRALAADRFSSGTLRYLLCKDYSGEVTQISEDTFKQLKAFRLIRQTQRSDTYRWWWSWYGRSRCFILSDAGKDFKLPPSELWVEA